MNKIYKVMYSKVKQCAVVVSEIAKSHGHNGESSDVRKHAALTAAVLIALGSLSFTTAFVPMTAEAATKTGGSNFVGVERTDGLLDDKEYDNYGGKGANGADSITLGLRAKAGEGTITIGDRNAGASLGSVYVGQGDIAKPKLDTGGWVTSIGYNSDATGYGSIALGSNAVARNSYALDSKGESLDLNPNFRLNSKPDIQRASVAIGYGANADNGNIAIGSYSDASTDLRTAKTKDGKEINSYLTDTKADSYVSVGKTGALRRISNVADGAADSDAATIAQLKKAVFDAGSGKANIDASNIGNHIKVYKMDEQGKVQLDGNKNPIEDTDATTTAQNTNKNAWGTAIGTGSIANSNTNGSGQLVTGTTVYNYVSPKAVDGKKLEYISEDKSTGTNLGILDDKVSTNATDITGLKSLSNITDNGKTVIKKAAVGAVKVTAGDRITVTPDSKNLTDADTVTYTISAKNDGKVASGNSGLVSGDTVYQALQNQTKSLTYNGGWGINIDSSKKISLKNNLTTVIYDNGSSSSKDVKFNIADTAMAIGGAIFNNSGWTSYVDGKTMTINSTGRYSVRLGGINNSTTGIYSTVTGGSANVASGYASSVNGGKNNTASGKYATVIGGGYLWTEAYENGDFPDVDESIFGSDASSYRNDASGILSTIIGGYGNKASGKNSLIVGGLYNEAGNESASIFGGGGNRADGDRTTISGGANNFAVGDYSNVSGGIANTTEGRFSTISGGYGNIIVDEGPMQPNRTYYGFPASGKYGSAFGGGYNVVGGENGTAVGGGHSVVYGIRSVGLAGGSTGLGAHYALAAGYQSVVTTKGSKLLVSDKRNEFTDDYYYDNHGYAYKILGKEQNSKHLDFIPEYEDVATAVGYQATANEPDTISFGHDVGDVSGYDVKWKERTDKDEWGNINTNPDGTINDYAKKPDIIINHYDTAKYNRLVKVADGINNHDVVVMEQLRNADNVGKNAKNNVVVYKKNTNGTLQVDENGEAVIDVDASKAATEKATEQAIKDSGDAWGRALGTGKVEANNSQLVTGDTVYNAIQNQAEWKLTTNGESADKAVTIKPGTTVDFSAEKNTKEHSNVTISHKGSNVTIGLDKDIVLGDTTPGNGGSLNVYSDSSDGNNQSNHVSINGSTISVNYPKTVEGKTSDARGVILGVGEEDSKPDGYIAFNNVEGGYTYLHASTDASDDKKGRLEYVGNDGKKKYIANLDDVSTAVNNAKTKYYSVNENLPKIDGYTNEGNDGAKGMGSIAAGFNTHADGIASTVAGSYSGVLNQDSKGAFDLRGATALSYGTFNINQNTDATKEHSGVANSIVGQANATIDSNAAIIYGAGNTVTNSYRAIDTSKFDLSKVKQDIAKKDAAAVAKDLQEAVPTSGGQVMVMGGGNSVDKAYMTQVVGVGNKVTGQDSTYAEKTSTQYNFVDGFQNELKNGKNDYIIGTKNKVSGDSVDKNQSNIIFGDNHTLTNTKNAVIIGSSDKVTEIAGSDAVSIGYNANAGGESVALGSNAVAGGNALAVGPYANAKNNSIALGIHASATSSQNLAIGYYANVTGRPDTIKNSVALGASSTVGEKDILSTDNGFGVLSIGAKDKERRIIHVRAGVNDTDAVNVSQLKSVQSGLTDKGLTFVTNDGEHIAKLGSKVTIQGTAKKADHEYTADNLTTEIDKDGNITILMDKDMSVEKLAVNGKPGTPGSIGVKGQDGQSGVGIDGKDGISIKGRDGKDGVTIKAVDGKDGTEGHIGLNGKDGMTDIFTTAGTPGLNGKDGETMTRIVYKDPKGTEHEAATLDDGLKFKGDDGKEIAKKLNNTLDIIGGAKGDLTEGNIGVNSTDKGQLKVQLAKDLKGITSISNQKTEGGKTTGAKITLGDDGSVNVNGGKITNVGSGADASGKYTETTNAANIGDVQKIAENTATGLTGKGLKFAANSGNEYTAKLGTTVKVLGTAKTEGHEYTADNLTTEIDEKGNITILMDKNVSAEKIAVNGKDGENGKPGTAGSIGISGQDGKAGVGIDGKDGISIKGQNGKDGVTIKGIDGVDGVDGAEGHIGLNGKDGMTDIFTTAGTPGLNGKDGETMTRIVYKDPKGTEHEAATLDDGLKFKGDDGKEIAKKLNNTLDIIGGAKGDLTEGNIGVNNDSGKLKVQLAKDLTGITSISNQTTTKVGGKDVTTGAKVTLGADGSVDVNGGKITHVGSGADASGNYTTTTNAANIGDVQKIVKDAVDSAADTTNKALAGKANVDASNIGANLKGEDGKTPATEAEKAKNENAWGSAIGTGKIEANNGQLVTGKTVYEYNKPVAEDGKTLNYVSEGKTTGQNLGALDAQVKNNADAIKKNSESIQNITNNVKNLSDNAVQYDKDSNKAKVTLGGDGGTTITNVKDGALSDSSSDAVNGKQLYNEQEARKAADKVITEKVTNNTNEITKIKDGEGFTDKGKTVIKSLAQDAVDVKGSDNVTVTNETKDGTKTFTVSVDGNGKVASGDKGLISGDTIYNELRPSADGSYIKKDSTTAQNLVSLDTQVKKTSDLINSDGKTIKIGGSDAATKIDVNGKDGKGRVITGVVSDANDPTSAANVGYVNGAYGRLNNNINKAAAGSNALAALHPLDYDPDDKADFAVGYGHYRNANAAAVGAFYHPNENTMVNVGVSLGNGDPGFNAGVSFKVGRGGAGREAMSKTEMAKVINSQSKEIDALKKDNADKDKRIDALEQKMAEILAKLDKNGK